MADQDHGAGVINLSLGAPRGGTVLADAVHYAASQDCVLVAAGGNENASQVDYPAGYSDCIAVGATAFHGATMRVLYEQRHGRTTRPPTVTPTEKRKKRELSDAEKEQVKRRDGYACLCCGATGKGIRLQIDHIVPYILGGETTVENSQTLCSVCNREKKINELNFLQTATLLPAPIELELLARSGKEDVEQSLTRLVNYFYRCRAVSRVRMHKRSTGQFYSTWKIELYSGNDPRWLNQHKRALLAHIQDEYNCPHVTNIKIHGPGLIG